MIHVRFRPQARLEIREARKWYNGQVAGLGRVFIAEVDATLNFIRLHPQMYSAVSEDELVRRALLHRFPNSLTYELLGAADILVLACRHVRQEEMNWNLARRDV